MTVAVVSPADFEWVRRLVADEHAGALGEDKEYLVRARLSPLAEHRGLDSVAQLIGAARSGEPELRRAVVEALLTHETSFFRDGHPFAALGEAVLPERQAAAGSRPLALWSAAASTGQEALSLAMLVRDGATSGVPAQILASDASHEALRRASAGRYSQLEVSRGLPADLRDRHFVRLDGAWVARDEVRRLVQFVRINLARPLGGAVGPMDVVLLRNVLIYLSEAARHAVLQEVARVLRTGGVLCLGGAETVGPDADRLFTRFRVGRTVLHRRTADPASGAVA